VDLSHEYSADAIFWPTAEGFRLDVVADGTTPQGFYDAANNFSGADHGGTHLDAPVHFAQGRWSVEQIPLDLGTAERGEAAVARLHFPGIHPEAARWLVGKNVLAVGIDAASIAYGQSSQFETHRVLYDKNIPGLENLTNLDRLPATGAFVVALPMKIRGGSGAPLRAIAWSAGHATPTVRP
jgi:kynurenine formamidase